MKVLIVEDEYHAQKRVTHLVQSLRPDIELLDVLDSVEDTVEWFEKNQQPDLMFLDIQLSDGLSFEIFTRVNMDVPVIFTTAYDEYAIKAFKINSVDYLLKPIEEEELEQAFQKFERLNRQRAQYDPRLIDNLLQSLNRQQFPERFLVKVGQQLSFVPVADIAYIFSENSLSIIQSTNGKQHIVDYTLDQLENMVDPKQFFRINRKALVKIEAVEKVYPYFNNRLILDLNPTFQTQAIVSRERVKDFKGWLEPKNIQQRNRGTEEQRNRGTEEQRNRGTEEQRNRGTEEQRNRGTEEQRNRGTEEQRNRGTEE